MVAEAGVAGLWAGAVPGIARAALLTAAQCATYDTAKRYVMARMGWGDHVGTQVACALLTGLAATTLSNPADVVKTRMYVATRGPSGIRGGAAPAGPLATARELIAAEGPRALMKGWSANYSRLGPQTLVTFVVAERLRWLLGMSSL